MRTDETTSGYMGGYNDPIEYCNVCGRELMRPDEKKIGACAVCMNEEIDERKSQNET